MEQIVNAEYQVVQERTLPVIASEIKIIEQQTAKTVLENGIQIGTRLQEAKEQVGHGNFEEWCKENLNYTSRTARKFMQLATEYGDENGLISNRNISSDLSISKALTLLKVPEEDREEFVEEHDVEGMTVKEMEEAIRTANDERDAANAHAEAQQKVALQATDDLEKERAKVEKANEKLKKEKDSRQKVIDEAIEKEREEIRELAKKEAGAALSEAEKARDDLADENAALKRKLENSGQEGIVKFKILVDQLQDVFDQAGQCILVEPNKDRADKMSAALKQVVEKFQEEL